MTPNKIIGEAYRKMNEYARSNLQKIDVEEKQGIFNYRCYYNACQFASKHPEYSVYEVVYFDDKKPTLHYINEKDGKFYETTLGYLCKGYEYFVIKKIEKHQYQNIINIFMESLKYWNEKYVGFYGRNVLMIDRFM